MFTSEAAPTVNKNVNSFLSNQANNYFQSADQNHNQSAGLSRYRSAPSSFLAALLDNDNNDSNGGDEAEAEAEALMFSDFFGGSSHSTAAADNSDQNLKNRSGVKNPNDLHRVNGVLKQEIVENRQVGRYEAAAVNGGAGAVVGSYSLGMEADVHLGMHSANHNNHSSSNLVRQSSSPAGFFNGFSVMGDVGSYRLQTSTSSSANNLSFSRTASYMPSIPENGNDSSVVHSRNAHHHNPGINSSREFFARDSWINSNDNDSFNGSSLKRNRGGDPKMNGESGKRHSGLVHHSSLPKTASEIATAEKFLHFQQDSIQVRAKRGCATHPRSIAERMRRTRISEKMKKLQDLFPNLDKQTNTADMLDMAVESIKELQKQVQLLEEKKLRCVCPNKA